MKTPILETERLLLRPLIKEDYKDVFECWESDSEAAKYMFWESHKDITKTAIWINEEISKIDSDIWYRWAITLKATNQLIGTAIIYFEEEYNKFEVAYNLGRKAWGFGYTTEAMKRILIFAKEELKIKEIIGRYATKNIVSGKVLQKLGFKYVKDIPYECNNGKNKYTGKEYILKL
jgi:ribosomal-protein-alanine N-acetyltransferase